MYLSNVAAGEGGMNKLNNRKKKKKKVTANKQKVIVNIFFVHIYALNISIHILNSLIKTHENFFFIAKKNTF